MENNKEFYISPNLENDSLTETIECLNESGENIKLPVVREIPLTIYLNKQEIVTAMTLGDMPDLLAVGYLLNQNMLKRDDIISEIDYDQDLQVVIVRTERKTNYEKKMEKKIRTSGCAVGTVYGDIMNDFSSINLDKKTKIKTSWIYTISKKVNTRPSLYLKAGALHGCVLCKNDSPLIYVEDVGRHNALDKLIGDSLINNNLKPNEQFITCSGRLNFELVQKVLMTNIGLMIGVGAPTSLALDLANRFDMTLVGFVKEDRFNIYTNKQKVIVS